MPPKQQNQNQNDDDSQQEQQTQQQTEQQQQQDKQRVMLDADDEEDEEQEAFVDLNNNPDFELVDDNALGGDNNANNNDDDDDDNEDEEKKEENEGIPIVDKTPHRDDSFIQFFPPRIESRLPLHAIAVHPTVPNIVATAGEQDVCYVLRLPMKFDDIPAPTVSSTAVPAVPGATEEVVAEAEAALKGTPYSVPDNGAKNTWDVFAILQGHKDTITKIAFSPNGKLLATGAMDGKVILWNSDPAKAPSCLHHLNDLDGEIECILWHPSSLMVVAGSTNAQIILWNAQKGSAAQYFSGHRDVVTCIEWSNDFKKLISASADGSVMMYNPKTGAAEVTVAKGISEENAGICSMIVMPNSSNDATPMVLVGCVDGSMALVSLAAPKGRVLKNLPEVHDQAVESIAMTPRGTTTVPLVASCSCDCKLVLWSVPELAPVATIHCDEGMTKVMWLNSLVCAGCTDGDIRCWESRTAAGEMKNTHPQVHMQGHRRLVLDMGVSTLRNPGNGKVKNVVVACADDGYAKAYAINAPQ